MKSLKIITLSAIITLGFACSKDDDNDLPDGEIIDASTIEGYCGNSSVKVMDARISFKSEDSDNVSAHRVATCNVTNGKFKFDLPEEVEEYYLTEIRKFEYFDFPELKISDENAKIGEVYFVGYANTDRKLLIAKMRYVNEDDVYSYDSNCYGIFIYSDRDVKITGTHSEEYYPGMFDYYKYNVRLKKGWTLIFETDGETPDVRFTYTNNSKYNMDWKTN